MQYGNTFSDIRIFCAFLSLNRTMQYGNNCLVTVSFVLMSFKSYYVVWKHSSSESRPNMLSRLNRTMQYGNSHLKTKKRKNFLRFKSYYVVWKPTSGRKFRRAVASLNRTMQYGNSLFGIEHNSTYCRLNRTMQYGNYTPKKNHFPFSEQFKSYYVVWKQVYMLMISPVARSV